MKTAQLLHSLQESLQPLREKLVEHEIYQDIKTLPDLRIFMEHHVFAVWDFMSLLKALQHDLTCVTIPWMPQGDPLSRRLINEIVMEEESDTENGGGYISHFELYRAAMAQCRADISRIDRFLDRLRSSEAVTSALEGADAPKAAQAFAKSTMTIVQSGSIHSIAAAFTLGREDVIPKMFAPLLTKLEDEFPGQLTVFRDCLERHIRLDEERHTPMGLQMLAGLCGDDSRKWREAEETARIALIARIALWDGVAKQIAIAKSQGMVISNGPVRRCSSPITTTRTGAPAPFCAD